MFDERPDTESPRELMGEERDWPVELQVLEGSTDGQHVEVEDPTESMVGHEQDRAGECGCVEIDLEAVVAPDKVDCALAEGC